MCRSEDGLRAAAAKFIANGCEADSAMFARLTEEAIGREKQAVRPPAAPPDSIAVFDRTKLLAAVGFMS